MPRPAKATWIPPRAGRGGGHWITRAFGPISGTTGRRVGIRNSEIGPPSGREGPANRAEAQRWVDSLAEAERSAERRAGDPLVEDLIVLYLDWAERNVAPRTLHAYQERLRKFAAFRRGEVFYGELVASRLRPADLSRFLESMKRGGFAPGYINSIVLSVQAMLNWAADPIEDRVPERILASNPFRGVRRPKNPRPPKRYSGPAARRAFLEFAFVRACRNDPRSLAWRFDRLFIALVRLAEGTGCRPSEACRLEWGHVQWDDGLAILKGKSTEKTGRKRVLPLTPELLRMLRAIERLPGRHPRFVFTHMARDGSSAGLAGVPWAGNALAHRFRTWRDEAIAAGLPIAAVGDSALTMYALRRDMGADVLRMTGSHAESAEVLGHSPEINARHYASFEDERTVELARRVAAVRRSVAP